MSEKFSENVETNDVSEQVAEASEEDVQEVEDNQQKAQAVAWEIKKSQASNTEISYLLMFLLKNIDDFRIVSYCYRFYTYYQVSLYEVVWLVIPFLKKSFEKEENNLDKKNFEKELEIKIDSLVDYGEFLREKIQQVEEFKNVTKEEIVDFAMLVLFNFDVWNINNYFEETENQEEYKKNLRESLLEKISL